MKSQRSKQNQFSKIIIQIDNLKKQVFSLINNLQDKRPTSQRNILSANKINEDQRKANKKLSLNGIVYSKRILNKQNCLKERSPGHKAIQIKRINQRVERIQKSNRQMQKSAIILQNELHLQKARRKMLQRKILQKQKTSFAVHTGLEGSKSSRLFTPVQKSAKRQFKATCICSNTRDQQEDDSLLLGPGNQLIYSPKAGKHRYYGFNVIDSTNEIGSANQSQTQLSKFGQNLFGNS